MKDIYLNFTFNLFICFIAATPSSESPPGFDTLHLVPLLSLALPRVDVERDVLQDLALVHA